MPFEIFSLWSKTQIGHKEMSRHFFGVPFHSIVKGEIYKMNNERKIAGIYIRVSTEDQVRERI